MGQRATLGGPIGFAASRVSAPIHDFNQSATPLSYWPTLPVTGVVPSCFGQFDP
jgi:hypothetical protein